MKPRSLTSKLAKDSDKQQLQALTELLAATPRGDPALTEAMRFLQKQRHDYHWVGIYKLEGDTLVLGPYCGPATDHTRIPVGRGVCGTAVAENRNQIVGDVSTIGNYLACNLDTKSELVILIREPMSQRVLGQIDVDGRRLHQFDADEVAFVEAVAEVLAQHWQA